MMSIEQSEIGVDIRIDGNLPDLICDLAVLYLIVSARGAALGYDVGRLVKGLAENDFIQCIADEWKNNTGSMGAAE